MTLRDVALVLILSAVVPAILSAYLVMRTPWRETAMGRHLMAYSSVIALVLVVSLVRRMFPDPPFALEVIRLATFALVPVVIWWRCLLQIKAMHDED